MDLVVLYEDQDLIVLDKPAGLVVHPAPGHRTGTLVNGLLHHCGELAGAGGVLRPGIVHRLDRGTSGVMVAANGGSKVLHRVRRSQSMQKAFVLCVSRAVIYAVFKHGHPLTVMGKF